MHVLYPLWIANVCVDKVLPFDLRLAPKLFCAISDVLEWILHTKGLSACLHFVDHIWKPNLVSKQCCINLHILIQAFQELGLPLALVKIKGLEVITIFLGIELNTIFMTVRLPDE